MNENGYHHQPVLLGEVIRYLAPAAGASVIDATLGGGGYSQAILDQIGPKGYLLAIDLDQDAIKNFQLSISNFQNVTVAHGNFVHIDKIVKNHDFPPPEGIVADLGLSSYELDQAGRGISFQKQEPLDMRFDQSTETEDAKFILNNYEENKLVKIFREYGEEKFALQISRKIIKARSEQPIYYTTDLYEIIRDALPKPVKHKADDSARRIFQALRIAVNHELENLQEFLPKAFDLLAPGGRMVVVSFHSLEDRMVKQFFAAKSKGCICPIDFPECRCGKNPEGKILTKKPGTASEAEIKNNPRSKPAKLRAIIKL